MNTQFKSLDPSRYQWTQSHEDSRLWRRGALAGENLWIQRPREVRQLFLGANLYFPSSSRIEEIYEAALNSWFRLLVSNPHVMVAPSSQSSSENLSPSFERLLEYRVPEDEKDDAYSHDHSTTTMKAWIKKTFLRQTASSAPLGFDDMRLRLMDRMRGQPELICILLHEVVDKSMPSFSSQVEIVLLADHLMTDGIGIRILLGKYLALIAEELAIRIGTSSSKPPVELPLSRQMLAEPWYNSMDRNQIVSGKEYEAAVKAQEKFLLSDTTDNWGLPVASSKSTTYDDHPKTACHSITLSENQSTELLRSVKSMLGPTATITHLAHAATVLALLRSQPLPLIDNPSDKEKNTLASLCSPCWMNGRPYLSKHESLPDPELSYIPVCQAMGQVVFHGLRTMQLSTSATRYEVLRALLACSEQAMKAYAAMKARRSILSESLPLIDLIGDTMASRPQRDQRESADDVTASPILPSDGVSNPQTGQTAPMAGRRATPFLLSDGIGERYINRKYGDKLSNVFFEVQDLKFVANAEGPNLIVRLSTWRDKLSVSGEWKEGDYKRDMVEAYLNDVADLLLTIVDPEIVNKG